MHETSQKSAHKPFSSEDHRPLVVGGIGGPEGHEQGDADEEFPLEIRGWEWGSGPPGGDKVRTCRLGRRV